MSHAEQAAALALAARVARQAAAKRHVEADDAAQLAQLAVWRAQVTRPGQVTWVARAAVRELALGNAGSYGGLGGTTQVRRRAAAGCPRPGDWLPEVATLEPVVAEALPDAVADDDFAQVDAQLDAQRQLASLRARLEPRDRAVLSATLDGMRRGAPGPVAALRAAGWSPARAARAWALVLRAARGKVPSVMPEVVVLAPARAEATRPTRRRGQRVPMAGQLSLWEWPA